MPTEGDMDSLIEMIVCWLPEWRQNACARVYY